MPSAQFERGGAGVDAPGNVTAPKVRNRPDLLSAHRVRQPGVLFRGVVSTQGCEQRPECVDRGVFSLLLVRSQRQGSPSDHPGCEGQRDRRRAVRVYDGTEDLITKRFTERIEPLKQDRC